MTEAIAEQKFFLKEFAGVGIIIALQGTKGY